MRCAPEWRTLSTAGCLCRAFPIRRKVRSKPKQPQRERPNNRVLLLMPVTRASHERTLALLPNPANHLSQMLVTHEYIIYLKIIEFSLHKILPSSDTVYIYKITALPAGSSPPTKKRKNGRISRNEEGKTICRAYKTENGHWAVESFDNEGPRHSSAPLSLREGGHRVQI